MNYSEKELSYFSEEREDLYPFFNQFQGKILDIGCGMGGFINGLKKINKNKIEAWGIEPNVSEVKNISPQIDNFYQGFFDNVKHDIPLSYFDCICFNDVLEHLYSPEEMLEKVKPYLNNEGYIFASIPNFLFFPNLIDIVINQNFEYTTQGILDYTHIRFFTKKTIIKLFENQGYEIETIQGINYKLFNNMKIYKFLNFITFNRLYDFRFMQFVVKAKLKT
jgi:2-polyprenyl-3-methyl-5-hydroxy-6-metoxy-1,4-benzoquinol methylase